MFSQVLLGAESGADIQQYKLSFCTIQNQIKITIYQQLTLCYHHCPFGFPHFPIPSFCPVPKCFWTLLE